MARILPSSSDQASTPTVDTDTEGSSVHTGQQEEPLTAEEIAFAFAWARSEAELAFNARVAGTSMVLQALATAGLSREPVLNLLSAQEVEALATMNSAPSRRFVERRRRHRRFGLPKFASRLWKRLIGTRPVKSIVAVFRVAKPGKARSSSISDSKERSGTNGAQSLPSVRAAPSTKSCARHLDKQ